MYTARTIILLVLVCLAATVKVWAAGEDDIFKAVSDGDLNKVKALVNENPKLAAIANKDHSTPLHEAAIFGQLEIAEFLIAKGAVVDAVNTNGFTPLSRAARFGQKAVAELLIAKGADVNAKDKEGKTPLWWAKDQKKKDLVELLKSKGAKE